MNLQQRNMGRFIFAGVIALSVGMTACAWFQDPTPAHPAFYNADARSDYAVTQGYGFVILLVREEKLFSEGWHTRSDYIDGLKAFDDALAGRVPLRLLPQDLQILKDDGERSILYGLVADESNKNALSPLSGAERALELQRFKTDIENAVAGGNEYIQERFIELIEGFGENGGLTEMEMGILYEAAKSGD